MISIFLLPFVFLFSPTSCDSTFPAKEEVTSYTFQEGYEFPYDFKAPAEKFILPDELLEISGLTLAENGTKLAAVQDEEGVIYILDKKTGQIEKEYPFYTKGDYEGIEMVNGDLYIVKSKGDVYHITDLGKDVQKVKIYETFLNKTANVEGLGYDPVTNQLLLACKGKLANGEEKSFSRAIYGFDLKTNKLIEKPIINIDLNEVTGYINSGEAIKFLEKIKKKLDPAKGFIFGPSGIAIHPETKNIYIISSVGKMLMILNPTGKIIHIEKFNKKIHSQPEGICFDKDGTMWISNEADESRPSLIKYGM